MNIKKNSSKNMRLEALNIKVEDKDFESDDSDTDCV
jgi:hypothetical protein